MLFSYRHLFILIWYRMVTSQLFISAMDGQAFITLSNLGLEFSPIDEQAVLLLERNANTVPICAHACYSNVLCRILNFDSQSKRCRLYEGDIDSTGSVIAASSTQSLTGLIKLTDEDFTSRGLPCSSCEGNRYLICLNSICQCQPHTFFNGSICVSQKLMGVNCAGDIQCRKDLQLNCLSNMQCGFNQSLEQTIYVTSTTTSNSSSTSTSTTVTTTTTTPFHCNASCLNQTWTSSGTNLAQWLFDGSFNDERKNYNLTSTNNVSFTPNGYVKQAVVFTPNAFQMLTGPYVSLSNSSFTIDVWLYITQFLNIVDHAIVGLCPISSTRQCLHLTIRQISSNYYLYLGFYYDDCQGVTPLQLNTWFHAAFVFDLTTRTQQIYLNGILENSRIASGPFIQTSGNTTIGYIQAIEFSSPNNYFRGYMDRMTVANTVRSSCEILEIATLVTYFTFDSGLFLTDSGPNALQAITSSTTLISTGRFSQAITFNGSPSSYFQMSGFTALGISNRSFSVSLWIRPATLSGIILHVSANATGGDGGWCLPFLAFTTNGSLITQISNSNGTVSVSDPTFSVAISVWSHVVQTWSSTNGLRLFINNILVASRLSLATTYVASTVKNFITLGNSLHGANTCNSSQVGNYTPYIGDMDDFRVYSRELSTNDVCRLYTN